MAYRHELNQEAAMDYGYDIADLLTGAENELDITLLLDEAQEAETEEWRTEYSKITDILGSHHIEDESVLERAEQADEELATIVHAALREYCVSENIHKLFDLVERTGI